MEKLRFKQEDGTDYPEWKESALGDFLVPVRYERVEHPEEHELLTVKLHGRGVKRTGAKPNRTENGRPYYKRQEGELLIGRQNVHNGGFGLVGADESGLICSNAIGGYTAPGGTEYIFQFLSSIYSTLEKYTEGTGAKEIPQKAFHALKFNFPSLPEQERIATFLGLLDERIEAQRVLVSGLEEEKRGYMQAMLSPTPTLRFKQNDGTDYPDWEKTTLGEMVVKPASVPIPERFIYVDLESVKGGQLVSRNWVNKSDAPSRAQRVIKSDDVLFQTVRPYQVNNFMVGEELSGMVASSAYALLRAVEGVSPSFVYQVVSSQHFTSKVLDMCVGGMYPAISGTDLLRIVTIRPSFSEQEKIASFLGLLDNRLEAEKEKLAALEQEKRGFAQRLFL